MRRLSELRVFDSLLWLVIAGLVLFSAIVVLMIASAKGNVTLDSTLRGSYGVTLPQGGAIEVVDGNVVRRQGLPPGEEVLQPPQVGLKATLDPDDVDSRVVAAIGLLAVMGVAVFGLVNLLAVFRSARDADPFVTANVTRLRRVAAAAIAFPLLARVLTWVLDATLDNELDLAVQPPGPNIWTGALTAFGLLALAHVFRAGVELRELEQGTV